jgi:hypothetical protein
MADQDTVSDRATIREVYDLLERLRREMNARFDQHEAQHEKRRQTLVSRWQWALGVALTMLGTIGIDKLIWR